MFEKKYKILYQDKGIIKEKIVLKDSFDTLFLPKNIISIKPLGFNLDLFKKIGDKQINEKLYELTLMLDSNINLNQAFEILIKNEKDGYFREFLRAIQNSFINSLDIKEALSSYSINPLIVSLFELIQKSGNIDDNIRFLSDITKENQEIKSSFFKIMLYPIVLSCAFIFSLIGIIKFVLPNFESLFAETSYNLPLATKFLFALKEFSDYRLFLSLFLFVIFWFIGVKIYKRSVNFRVKIDTVLVKKGFFITRINYFKTMHIYFTVVHILLKNRYEFLDSIGKAKVLLNNQYLFDKITQIENLLKSGKSVSFAFQSSSLFDDVVLSLLDTGEVSNSLSTVIQEIKKIYKRRFDNSIRLFSLMIEPIFFIIIMTLILWIIFAIFVPLWSMNDLLKF